HRPHARGGRGGRGGGGVRGPPAAPAAGGVSGSAVGAASCGGRRAPTATVLATGCRGSRVSGSAVLVARYRGRRTPVAALAAGLAAAWGTLPVARSGTVGSWLAACFSRTGRRATAARRSGPPRPGCQGIRVGWGGAVRRAGTGPAAAVPAGGGAPGLPGAPPRGAPAPRPRLR